ncbi:MAG: hypothetical protein IT447_16275 [Phycisphaerales bacterium]|jgi:hypothetical protein|nr:hypothetical protein [Phycisphaerales bacterium]
MIDINPIVKNLKWVLSELESLSPPPTAKECERVIRDIIKRLSNPSVATKPKQRIKPCWRTANRVYEWGIKNLPPENHNYRDIHTAAINNLDAPKVALPANAGTFVKHVQRYRRAKGLPTHQKRSHPT